MRHYCKELTGVSWQVTHEKDLKNCIIVGLKAISSSSTPTLHPEVVTASGVVNTPNVPTEKREWTSVSLLFSQLAAKVDKQKDPIGWFKQITDNLQGIGWICTDCNFDKCHLSGPEVSVKKNSKRYYKEYHKRWRNAGNKYSSRFLSSWWQLSRGFQEAFFPREQRKLTYVTVWCKRVHRRALLVSVRVRRDVWPNFNQFPGRECKRYECIVVDCIAEANSWWRHLGMWWSWQCRNMLSKSYRG